MSTYKYLLCLKNIKNTKSISFNIFYVTILNIVFKKKEYTFLGFNFIYTVKNFKLKIIFNCNLEPNNNK